MFKKILFIFFIITNLQAYASYILIPMDQSQSNHLKAYGIAYWVLQKDQSVDWLLNYKGGSFMISYHQLIEKECQIRGVSYQIIADVQSSQILRSIASSEVNQDVVR